MFFFFQAPRLHPSLIGYIYIYFLKIKPIRDGLTIGKKKVKWVKKNEIGKKWEKNIRNEKKKLEENPKENEKETLKNKIKQNWDYI